MSCSASRLDRTRRSPSTRSLRASPGGRRFSRRHASPTRSRSKTPRNWRGPARTSSPSRARSLTQPPRPRRPRASAAPPTLAEQPRLPPRADGKPPDLTFGAYQRGNFLIALQEALRRIEANPKDAAAITLVGVIYRDGAAVGRNEAEAARWFRIASNLGDPQAAFELCALLLQGADGLAKDPAAAKQEFERAAAKNHPGALYNLGVMALGGEKPDYAKAAQFFLRAAEAGDENAFYSYGVMEREGKGVAQDVPQSAPIKLQHLRNKGNILKKGSAYKPISGG